MSHHNHHLEVAKHLESAAQHLQFAAKHHFHAHQALNAGVSQKAAYHSNLAIEHVLHAEDFQDHAMRIYAQKNIEEDLAHLKHIKLSKIEVHHISTNYL